MLLGQFARARGKFAFGQQTKMAQHRIAIIRHCLGQRDDLIGESQTEPAVEIFNAQRYVFSSKKKMGAIDPRSSRHLPRLPLGSLF